jgi:CMP-N-acetylneuraminic acid synthetase
MNEKILALIPARGGSKGVPRKNIRRLGDHPLIAYTIKAAMEAMDVLGQVIVSTDDEEIAGIARQYGADVPFIRPAELGADKARMVPVMQHAVKFVEERQGKPVEWVMLLQPTTPFREADDIRAAVKLAQAGGCDSVISVVQVFGVHPILMKRIENEQLLPFCIEEKEGTRRQDYQPAAYMRNGAIYLTRRDGLIQNDSIWGKVIRPYVMPEERSVNIDNEMDFLIAEQMLLKKRQKNAG